MPQFISLTRTSQGISKWRATNSNINKQVTRKPRERRLEFQPGPIRSEIRAVMISGCTGPLQGFQARVTPKRVRLSFLKPNENTCKSTTIE